jgi:hypothetical protein
MQRSRRNVSVLILTCLIQMSDGSRMTHLIWCVGWIRLQPYLSIVSPYFSSDPFPERRLSPTSTSHRPSCCRKSTLELHFLSGAAIGSHHSSLPNCFPFLPHCFGSMPISLSQVLVEGGVRDWHRRGTSVFRVSC